MSHLMSLLGVKRTWAFAPHMSAFDPKRTLVVLANVASLSRHDASPEPAGRGNEAARFHQSDRWWGGRMATWGARTTTGIYAPHRRAHELRGGRSGSAGAPDGIPASAATVGLDERWQRADRHSLECG